MNLLKRLIVFLVFLTFTSRAYLWDIVPATSAPIVDFHFFDADTGIAVGYDVVMHTVDGGRNWTYDTLDSPPHGALELELLRFSDRTHGFAAPKKGYLCKTSDAGMTWETFRLSSYEMITGLDFANKDSGLIIKREGIEVTHDGGASWTYEEYPGENFHGCQIISRNEWTVYGGNNRVLISRDAGVTWDTLQTPDRNEWNEIYRAHFSDTLNGVIYYFSTSDVALTADGGETWKTIDCVDKLKEWQIVGLDTIFALNWESDRSILRSFDRGASWETIPLELGTYPTGFQMVNGSVGYAVDKNYRALYRTSDGWNTMERLDNKTGGKLISIAFGDSLHGIAVGHRFGKYTHDGGKTWVPMDKLRGSFFRGVHFTSSRRAIVLDNNRNLVETMDAGIHWDTITNCDFRRLHQVSSDTFFADNSERISRSVDGGTSWEAFLPDEDLGFVYHLSPGSGQRVFVVHKSSNDMPERLSVLDEESGLTPLRQLISNEGENLRVQSLCAVDTGTIMFSAYGVFGRSDDGGLTWTDAESPNQRTRFSMTFMSPLRGWALDQYNVQWTFDGGKTWLSENYDRRSGIREMSSGFGHPNQMFAFNNDLVWCTPWGDGIMVYRRSLSINAPDTVYQNQIVAVHGRANGISGGLACRVVSSDGSSREVGRIEFDGSREFMSENLAPDSPGTYRLVVQSIMDTTFFRERTLVVKKKLPLAYNNCLDDTLVISANSTRQVFLGSCFTDSDDEDIAFSVDGAQWATLLDGGVLQLAPSEQDSSRPIDITATDIIGNTTTVSFLARVDYSTSVVPGSAVLSYAAPRILGFSEPNNAITLGLTQKQTRIVHVRIYGTTGRRIAEKNFAVGPGASTRRIELGRVRADGAFLVEVTDGASVVRKTILKAD